MALLGKNLEPLVSFQPSYLSKRSWHRKTCFCIQVKTMNWETGDDASFWFQSKFPASAPDVMWADCQLLFLGSQLLYLPCYDWLQILETVDSINPSSFSCFWQAFLSPSWAWLTNTMVKQISLWVEDKQRHWLLWSSENDNSKNTRTILLVITYTNPIISFILNYFV